MVYDPAILSPAVLPKEMRDEIHKTFKKTFNKDRYEALINMFSKPHDEKQWEQAKEYTRNLDEIRDQNIEDYLPEFKSII